MTLLRTAYTSALRAATPALLLYLGRRTRRQAGMRDDWRARLGYGRQDARAAVWLHGSSAGEMQSLAPLAAALARSHPLRLTAFTATGLARARMLVPEMTAELSPLDLPGAWRRYFERAAPRLAVLAEGELWPNLLATAARRSVPVVVVSACMSARTAQRLAHFPATSQNMMRGLEQVLAQSEQDLARFIALGLPRERGSVTGSLKTALAIPPSVREQGTELRKQVFPGLPVWVAGSVRMGEEADVAEAVATVRSICPEAIALVVPRHPETAPAFAAALRERAIRPLGAVALDSGTPVTPGSVVLVDRVGTLLALYAAADAAFVGGTLSPVGGHNVLEPALLERPVVVGPMLDNVRTAAAKLKTAGALVIARDGTELGREMAALLAAPEKARIMGQVGARAASDSAALERTIQALENLL